MSLDNTTQVPTKQNSINKNKVEVSHFSQNAKQNIDKIHARINKIQD